MSTDAHAHTPTLTLENSTIKSESLWRKFPIAGLVVGLGCLALAFVLGTSKAHHGDHAESHTQFYFSYITAMMFWLAIALGALFFVLIQHGTRAGWSIVVRRIAENWMATLPVFALLIVPVIIGVHDAFEWSHPREPGQDLMLDIKAPYLDETMFIVRSFGVIAVWSILAMALYRWSTKQDRSGDPRLTHKMRWWAPLGYVLFALSVTVASIDWMMSLQPHWYSTIFGVNYFSGAVMSAGAAITLAAMALQKSDMLKDAVTTEHYHDLGKWSFAFLVFWSYTAVSQLLLIWYANIPEETMYYHHRVQGGWEVVSVILALVHFVIPFWFLMSRHVKRRKSTLALGAVIILFAQYVDMYWIVQPNLPLTLGEEHTHFAPHIADILTLVGIGGIVTGVFAWITTRNAVAPVRDPRIAESLRFENQ